MQFAVPQFTEVEDKIIGPLTLKQFFVLLATGGLVLFFWSIFGFSILFFLFALPMALVGGVLAFGKFNGRVFFVYIMPFVSYLTRPKVLVFRHEEMQISLPKKVEPPKQAETTAKEVLTEEAESRLKKLAYLLDQKTTEEEEIIQKIPG